MKTLVTAYTFDPATRTLILTGYSSLYQEGILMITNTTDNIILYNFADPAYKVTVTGNIITMTYDTTSMSSTDDIQIWYDDGASPSTEATLAGVYYELETIKSLVAVPSFTTTGGTIATVAGTVAIAGMTGTNTITTVTTVTGLTNIGGFSADQVTFNTSAIQWANCIRNMLI